MVLASEWATRGTKHILSLGSRSFVQPLNGFRLRGKTLAENGGLDVALEPDGVSGI
jgi:hypothetical protein